MIKECASRFGRKSSKFKVKNGFLHAHITKHRVHVRIVHEITKLANIHSRFIQRGSHSNAVARIVWWQSRRRKGRRQAVSTSRRQITHHVDVHHHGTRQRVGVVFEDSCWCVLVCVCVCVLVWIKSSLRILLLLLLLIYLRELDKTSMGWIRVVWNQEETACCCFVLWLAESLRSTHATMRGGHTDTDTQRANTERGLQVRAGRETR